MNVATAEAERVSRTLAERGLYVTELRPEEVDLETVFLELTRDQGIDARAGVMTDLIRSELLRIWSRRMVRVLAIVAVVGATAGVVIGAIQSHPPDLVTAQRNYDGDLQHCLAGEFIPEDQLPPGETLDTFCADNIRLENYVNNSLRLAELSGILKGTAFILIVLGLVIGASSVGADWQAGTMAALLTWEPRRMRVYVVRVVVVLGSVFVLAVALQIVLALEIAAAAALRGTTLGTGSPWLRDVAGTDPSVGGPQRSAPRSVSPSR